MKVNNLAEKSGVSRQRLGDMIKNNRCPAEHNFNALLKAMRPDEELKEALISAYQMQRKANADRKLKTGNNMKEDAMSQKILKHYEIRIIPKFEHHPCTEGVKYDLDKGLHSILNCLNENNRKHLLHYQGLKDELQEYFDMVEAKSGMEMESFASAYKTRVGAWITFLPKDRADKTRLQWNIDSIFDGLVINRSGFPFAELLWDIPLQWNDNKHSTAKKRKSHDVSIRSHAMKESGTEEEDADYFRTLRSFSIPSGKVYKPLSVSDIYRAIAKELEMKAIDLKGQQKEDTVPIKRGDIYELCDCLHQMLKSQAQGKPVHDGITFQLRLLLSRLRTAPISTQFQAVLFYWTSKYFAEMARSMK